MISTSSSSGDVAGCSTLKLDLNDASVSHDGNTSAFHDANASGSNTKLVDYSMSPIELAGSELNNLHSDITSPQSVIHRASTRKSRDPQSPIRSSVGSLLNLDNSDDGSDVPYNFTEPLDDEQSGDPIQQIFGISNDKTDYFKNSDLSFNDSFFKGGSAVESCKQKTWDFPESKSMSSLLSQSTKCVVITPIPSIGRHQNPQFARSQSSVSDTVLSDQKAPSSSFFASLQINSSELSASVSSNRSGSSHPDNSKQDMFSTRLDRLRRLPTPVPMTKFAKPVHSNEPQKSLDVKAQDMTCLISKNSKGPGFNDDTIPKLPPFSKNSCTNSVKPLLTNTEPPPKSTPTAYCTKKPNLIALGNSIAQKKFEDVPDLADISPILGLRNNSKSMYQISSDDSLPLEFSETSLKMQGASLTNVNSETPKKFKLLEEPNILNKSMRIVEQMAKGNESNRATCTSMSNPVAKNKGGASKHKNLNTSTESDAFSQMSIEKLKNASIDSVLACGPDMVGCNLGEQHDTKSSNSSKTKSVTFGKNEVFPSSSYNSLSNSLIKSLKTGKVTPQTTSILRGTEKLRRNDAKCQADLNRTMLTDSTLHDASVDNRMELLDDLLNASQPPKANSACAAADCFSAVKVEPKIPNDDE